MQQAERFCSYFVSCPERTEEDRAGCIEEFERTFRVADCFDECKAVSCMEWLSEPPACVDPNAPIPDVCRSVIQCDDA